MELPCPSADAETVRDHTNVQYVWLEVATYGQGVARTIEKPPWHVSLSRCRTSTSQASISSGKVVYRLNRNQVSSHAGLISVIGAPDERVDVGHQQQQNSSRALVVRSAPGGRFDW